MLTRLCPIVALVVVSGFSASADSGNQLSLKIGATTLTAASMNFSAGPETLNQTSTQPYRVRLRGQSTVVCYHDLKITADRVTVVSDGDDPTSILATGNVRYIDAANDNLVLSGDRLDLEGGLMLSISMTGNTTLSRGSSSTKTIMTGSSISTDTAGEFQVAKRQRSLAQ